MNRKLKMVLLIALLAGCGNEYTGDVPDNAYCSTADTWSTKQTAWEARIFELINFARSVGANCTENDHYPPTHAYKPNSALVCAARVHSLDMYNRDYFDHINPEGEGPTERAVNAGFTKGGVAETIVGGSGSPEGDFAGWMGSPGHCSVIMDSRYHYIGIGTVFGSSNSGNLSTATFSAR